MAEIIILTPEQVAEREQPKGQGRLGRSASFTVRISHSVLLPEESRRANEGAYKVYPFVKTPKSAALR